MLAEGGISVNGKCVLDLHIFGTLLESIHRLLRNDGVNRSFPIP